MKPDRPSMSSANTTRSFVSPIFVSQRAARTHEQMNALAVINSVVSLVTPGLSERDRLRMERLRRAAERLTELVHEEASRDEAKSAPISSTVDVEALVRGVCELLHHRAEDEGIRLIVECEGGVLRGDGALLRETLFDLMNNAIDATSPGRTVHLQTRATQAGDQVWTIKDSGAGMPAQVMRSASVAMSHGGSLAFESKEGEGTTVRVWLPRAGREAQLGTARTRPAVDVVELRRGA